VLLCCSKFVWEREREKEMEKAEIMCTCICVCDEIVQRVFFVAYVGERESARARA